MDFSPVFLLDFVQTQSVTCFTLSCHLLFTFWLEIIENLQNIAKIKITQKHTYSFYLDSPIVSILPHLLYHVCPLSLCIHKHFFLNKLR